MINNNGQRQRKIHKVIQMRNRNGQLIEKDVDRTVTPEGEMVSIRRHPVEEQNEIEQKPNLFDALFNNQKPEQVEQNPEILQDQQEEGPKPKGFMVEIDIPLNKKNDDDQQS